MGHGDEHAAWRMVHQDLAQGAAPPALRPRVGVTMAHADEVGFQLFGPSADLVDRLAVGDLAFGAVAAGAKACDALIEHILKAFAFVIVVVFDDHAFRHHQACVGRNDGQEVDLGIEQYSQVAALGQGTPAFIRSVVCEQNPLVHANFDPETPKFSVFAMTP